MSLNIWSLILFGAHVLFYLAMILAISTSSTAGKLATLISAWLVYQVATIWYGLATGQIGFILMFAFQMIATVATVVISLERSSSEN